MPTFDVLPSSSSSKKKKPFDQMEFEWLRLKLLIPVDERAEESLELDSKARKTCELNRTLFAKMVEIYVKNVRFIQQLKDKHAVRPRLCFLYNLIEVVSGRTESFDSPLGLSRCSHGANSPEQFHGTNVDR